MPAHRKLSEDEIRLARDSTAKRREILEQAKAYPTLAQLAEQFHVTPRYMSEIINGRARCELQEQEEINSLSST
jgi:hypothetical protein